MITRDIVERDLQQLQEDITRMSGLVDTAIRRVIEALQAPSIDRAEAVIASIECLSEGIINHKQKTDVGHQC
jgi:hypothetical protein